MKIKPILFFLILLDICISMPNIPDHRITYEVEGHELKMPYYRNIPLGEVSGTTKRAIISIHGDGRNAEEHFSLLNELATNSGQIDSTIIIAPLYCLQEDINNYDLDSTVLFWPSSDWNAGDLSRSTGSNPRPAQISAFSIIDTIFHRLVENNSELEKIIFTGHSAGSQMVVRYGAGGRAHNNIIQEYDVDFLYVPTNTPSFLYMDSLRVADEDETPFEFVFPTSCGSANYYKYGLDNLNEYMEETGRTEIRNNFFNRNTIYLIGEYDIGGQSNNCARYIQGEHRLSRSYIFYSYLGSYYGDSVYQNHYLSEIPNAYHDFEDMVYSDCGIPVYFGLNLDDCEYIDPIVFNNFPPIADAGDDQIVEFGTTVILDGSNSNDPDGYIDSFLWSQIMGLPVAIDSVTQAITSFVSPNEETTLRFILTVVDAIGASSIDTVEIDIGSLSTHNSNEQILTPSITAYPNPFNGSSKITVNRYADVQAPIKIYDLIGREVASFEPSKYDSPNYIFQWNGSGKDGTQATSGLYFIVYKTQNRSLVKKITYLR